MKKLIAVLAVLIVLASGFAISPLLAEGDVAENANPLPYCDGVIPLEIIPADIPDRNTALEDFLFARYGVAPIIAEKPQPIPQGMSGLSPIHFNRQPTPEEYYWLLMHFRDLRR